MAEQLWETDTGKPPITGKLSDLRNKPKPKPKRKKENEYSAMGAAKKIKSRKQRMDEMMKELEG